MNREHHSTPRHSAHGVHIVHIAPFLLLAHACFLCTSCSRHEAPRETVACGDGIRTTVVHVPAGISPDARLPLVIALHGLLNNPEGAARQTEFDALADREGFVVAYPDARLTFWNIFDSRRDADDVQFICALIDQMVATHQVDPARVYLTGTSNGGMMVHTVARAVPERFAAIAPAFGSITRAAEHAGPPGVPMPTLVIHGTADRFIRWDGGGSSRIGLPWYASVPETVAFWAQNNGCADAGETEPLPDTDPTDGATASRTVYGGCRDGAEVVLYTVHGGGHNRPGSLTNPNGGYGRVCMDFNATEVTWAFFKTHSRPHTAQ